MRTVCNSREIGHLWAHQTQAYARNSNKSFYFEGKSIYSYGSHFEIARHIENDRGERAILFTSRDYSVTTSKHKGYVGSAIPADVTVFTCNDRFWNVRDIDYRSIIEEYRASITENIDKSKRARFNAAWPLEHALVLIAELNRFCEFFDVKPEGYPFKVDGIEELRVIADEKQRKCHEAWKYRQEHRHEIEAKRQAAYEAKCRELIDKWIAGEKVQYPYSYSGYNTPALLRINPNDVNEVETSKGASVPADHALRLYKFARGIREKGIEDSSFVGWKSNGHTFKVGVFQVDSIEANGTIHAGCHVIEWNEAERMGRILWERQSGIVK